MINHARTLLLNRDGATRPAASFYGEEFVPAEFTHLDLDGSLRSVWEALFAKDADDYYMNFRLAQYMRVLHSTEFVSYVTNLDPRITYELNRSLLREAYGVTIRQSDRYTLVVVDEPDASCSDGKMVGNWQVETLAGPAMRVANTVRASEDTVDVTYQNNTTSIFPLRGKGDKFKAYLLGSSISTPWIPGQTFNVRVLIRPDAPLQDVIAHVSNLTGLDELFTGGDHYATFRDLWRYHELSSYKLSGLLLAVIYRLEAKRTNG